MCSTFYRERLGALLGWYSEWTSCEQVITLCYLLSRISSIQAKFLTLFLASHPATADTRDVEILEQEANSPNFLSGLHREPDEVVLSHLLSHLPLLKVDSHLARREYMNLLPKVLLGSCEHAHYLDQCWQLLCLSVLHPAFPPDDKNSLNYWLIRLREKSRAVEHKQHMLGAGLMGGGPMPPHLPAQTMDEFQAPLHPHPAPHHLPPPPHVSHFPQIQPSLSSPGIPQHNNGPSTGTGNFFPLLNSPLPISHPPVSPTLLEAPHPHPHLQLQQSESGVVLTEQGVSAAEYSGRQNQMLWSHKHVVSPNVFKLPNGAVPHVNGVHAHQRVKEDEKGEPVIRSLSFPLSKKCNGGSPLQPQQTSPDFGMQFDVSTGHTGNSSSISGSSGEYDFIGRQDQSVFSRPGMKEVVNWLKILRLRKYQDIFSQLSYQEMISLDESKLECENVTTGARHKILQSIQKLSTRSQLMHKLDQDLERMVSVPPESQEFITILSDLRSVVVSPILPFTAPSTPPSVDSISLRPSPDSIGSSTSGISSQASHEDLGTLDSCKNNEGPSGEFTSPCEDQDQGPDSPHDTSKPDDQSSPSQPVRSSSTDSPLHTHLSQEEMIAEHKILAESKVSDVPNDDLASMIAIVISKVFSKLMLQSDLEDESFAIFLQTLDKAISHEAFTDGHKRLFESWKAQIEQFALRNHVFRLNKANSRKVDNKIRARNSWSAGTQTVIPLNKVQRQWKTPNRLQAPLPSPHAHYLTPPITAPVMQPPLSAVRSFPNAKYNHFNPIKPSINKTRSFPCHPPNNTSNYFSELHTPNDCGSEGELMCSATLANRIKCGPSGTIHSDLSHLQTNDVYIESLCRSMTDHALGDSTPCAADKQPDPSGSYL